MKTKTNLKAGGAYYQHNETMIRGAGLKLRTGVKAGGRNINHNETVLG